MGLVIEIQVPFLIKLHLRIKEFVRHHAKSRAQTPGGTMKSNFTCFVMLLIFASLAFAQEEEGGMEHFFTLYTQGTASTFTRTDRQIRLAPQAVTVITREQIEQSGATTLSEVLRFVPGFNSRVTPMGSQVGIRSFGSTPFSERVLFLIDGTPYNSPDKGGYPGHPAYEDFFPLDAIKRIEVIKGPGSSLYGYNAFFGVINIITENFIGKGNGTNDAIAKFGSRDAAAGIIRGGGKSGDWKYSYLGKYKQQLGPMRFLSDPTETPNLPNFNSANGTKVIDGTDVKNGDVYLKSEYHDLSLSYLFHRDDTDSYTWIKPRLISTGVPFPPITRSDGTIIPAFQDVIGCCDTVPTEQTLQFVDATYKTKFSNENNWQVKAFYNRRDGNTCGNCHNLGAKSGNVALLQAQDETNQRFFLNTQYDLILASHKIIFGADLQFDKTDKNIGKLDGIDVLNPLVRIPTDSDINSQAVYVQDEISFADNHAILTVGARLDHNEKTDYAISPNVSLVAKGGENFVFRALYGRAFRQPTWNDLFANTVYATPNLLPNRLTVNLSTPTQINFYAQQGNPNTDTEQIDTFEAGVEYDLNKYSSIKVDGFFNRVNDLIEAYDFESCDPNNPQFNDPSDPLRARCALRIPPTVLAVTKNLDRDLDSKGFEIEFRFSPSQLFSAIVGYSYQKDDFGLINTKFTDSFGNDSRTFLDAYSPENKITTMVNISPVKPLLFNFSLNYWGEYNTRFFPANFQAPAPAGGVQPPPGCRACTNQDEIGQPYTYANLSAFYTFPLGDQKLKLGLTIKNIFDEEVQVSHAFRVDAALPGREFFGLVQFSF
jgi:outer membrane receptor protein involved in Fe transport